MYTEYTRLIDCGNGTQTLLVNGEGIVTDQRITSNGNHHYTGSGNPELVGKSITSLRGWGFRKSRQKVDLERWC